MNRYRAGTVIVASADARASAEVTVVSGRVAAVTEVPPAELTAGERESVLAPAWINAHAHLELGALGGRVPAGEGFLDWVGALMAARAALSPEELGRGALASATELGRTGTARVLDIDSLDAVEAALTGASVPAVHSFAELLDASPRTPDARTEAALESALQAVARGRGLSPHGPHTVGDGLLGALSRDPRARSAPRTVHWAESSEEVEWLRDGRGPFAGMLGPSPRMSGLARLAQHRLLDGTLLVHGNLPEPGELELLGAARGVGVVHCPGCHRFFGRDPFPIERYRRLGVPILLGTDSAASNAALDMGREVRLARETLGLSPEAAFWAATEGPARWIADPSVTGTLQQGSPAELVRYGPHGGDTGGALEALTAGELERLPLDGLSPWEDA